MRSSVSLILLAPLLLGFSHRASAQHATGGEFLVGACTHFAQDKGYLPANLALMRQAGIGSLRDEVYWNDVERERGHLSMPEAWDAYVDRAREAGMAPLLILDYGNRFYDEGNKPTSAEARAAFGRYARFVVDHFKGRVPLYEVWNEYDIGIGTPDGAEGTPEDYVALLEETYRAIKEVDTTSVVLGGAVTSGAVGNGWLEQMVALGGLKYCDALSVHAYNYSAKGRARSPETWAAWMQDMREMLHAYTDGADVPVYVTEMGWPTHVGERGMTPDTAAAYLARMYLLARTMPYLKGLWWYDFQDDGWEATHNEHNFGLVRPDLTPKPAYYALKDVADLVATATYAGRAETAEEDLWVLKFEREGGEDAWAVWSARERGSTQVLLGFRGAEPPEQVRVREAGRGGVERRFGRRAWYAEEDGVRGGELSLAVEATPLLVTGDLGGMYVKGARVR